MFGTILVANRGEIAVRIIRTLKRLGIRSVAVYSDIDRFTRPVLDADRAIRIGPAPATASYLDIDALIAACRASGAKAVHPGYGFLSETIGFAERLAEAGIVFIGPRPEHLEAFGLKHAARALAQESGVPLLPGTGVLGDIEDAIAAARQIGYPVMLKSNAGGGGIGMQLCADAAELRDRYAGVQRTAQASFGDARVFLERYVADARHIEVQIFGDGRGRVVALGERDCSLQRRNQKVVEETPAPHLPEATRQRLFAAAVALGERVAYRSAGTVEFIYDPVTSEVYFLEVNTRLQVEHAVTEAVLGIDLVEWMIRQAAGEEVIPAGLPEPRGSTGCRSPTASPSGSRPARCWPSARSRVPVSAATSRCGAASRHRACSARAPPSGSAPSAATRPARCGRATSCTSTAGPKPMRPRPVRSPTSLTNGRSASSTGRTARLTSSRRPISTTCSGPPTRSISTAPAPA